jgi:hypothetical protein
MAECATTEADAWVKTFADRICIFAGQDYRAKAETAARQYLADYSIADDPDAAAVLVMEGWGMRR